MAQNRSAPLTQKEVGVRGNSTTRSSPVVHTLILSQQQRPNRLDLAPSVSWPGIREDGFDFQIGNDLFDA